MQRYAATRSAVACRSYATQTATDIACRPRDNQFVKHRRVYKAEVSNLRIQWRQQYLSKVEEEEAIRRAKAGEEARYVAAYREERTKARAQRREEMIQKNIAFGDERKAVREAYRQHKAALEAEEHARQQELLKQQQAERRNFVEGKSIVNRINVALQMPPVSANKPITPKK